MNALTNNNKRIVSRRVTPQRTYNAVVLAFPYLFLSELTRYVYSHVIATESVALPVIVVGSLPADCLPSFLFEHRI